MCCVIIITRSLKHLSLARLTEKPLGLVPKNWPGASLSFSSYVIYNSPLSSSSICLVQEEMQLLCKGTRCNRTLCGVLISCILLLQQVCESISLPRGNCNSTPHLEMRHFQTKHFKKSHFPCYELQKLD